MQEMSAAEYRNYLLDRARIAGRYMGAELAKAYGSRNTVSGELLVRVTQNIAD
jgi:hypothetical protein